DDVALHLGAAHHLLHVAAAHFLQRRAGQRMHMPGLRVHRRRRAFCDLEDLLDHRARDLLLLEAAHTFARLDQRLEFHSSAPVYSSWRDSIPRCALVLRLDRRVGKAQACPPSRARLVKVGTSLALLCPPYNSPIVIPGRASWRGPGIHTPWRWSCSEIV